MDPKLLTEDGWKAVALKSKVKGKELQQALFFYETLDENDFDFRLKSLAKVSALAAALKKTKEVAALPDMVKYLAYVVSAAEAEKSEVTKVKAKAGKLEN